MNSTIVKDLQSYQDKRRYPNWEIAYPKTKQGQPKINYDVYYGAETTNVEIVRRALAFLSLELQVQDWILSVPGFSNQHEVHDFLKRNAKDEQKHDDVLRRLEFYYGGAKKTATSEEIVNDWMQLTYEHPNVHPLAASYALEAGVFFTVLPALTKYGDVFAAAVAGWIIDDERCHVETALRILKELGETVPKECGKLVYRTIAYIFEPLGSDEAHKQAARSVQRLVTGVDKQMNQDSVPYTIAYFETNSKGDIPYGEDGY
jgi:hypothetical protein